MTLTCLDVDTLTPFSTNYQLMSIPQQIELAELFLNNSKQVDRILVVESGVSPIALIMQELLQQQGEEKKFFHLKIPREFTPDQFPQLATRATELREFTEKPFLILDEYIDSGHTMGLVLDFLHFCGVKNHYGIMAYMNFSENRKIKSLLHFTCADNPSKEEIFRQPHFSKSVYPFENRFEYAPYFYYGDKKIHLSTFVQGNTNAPCDESEHRNQLQPILHKIKDATPIQIVSDFISHPHLFLYSVFCKEIEPIRKQFFWNLFEMIGPFWTPLPKDYHFSYWKGFENIQDELNTYIEKMNFNSEAIACQAAAILLEKHEHWLKQIKSHIWSNSHVAK